MMTAERSRDQGDERAVMGPKGSGASERAVSNSDHKQAQGGLSFGWCQAALRTTEEQVDEL